ncbi:MAG: response regulator [Acidobacteria bacterium]|nr:response regulator [Acidobacteriota bacterium]
MRALIVDDEAPVRRLLHRFVTADGADVLEASSAEEALDVLAREGAPAVALCDLRLPGKDGLWLAGRLQEVAPDTAVVMATGFVDFDVAVGSLQLGVVDYVVKPFEAARLSKALWRAFHAHTTRRAQAALRGELEQQRVRTDEALVEAELNASSTMAAMLAMIDSGRPVADGKRTAVSAHQALDILRSERGSRFDPLVFDALDLLQPCH